MTDKNNNNSAPATTGTVKPLLRGTVVFYNKDKGFGFVRTEDEKDFHFGHRAFGGTKLPEAGDLVEFSVSRRLSKPGKSPNVEHMEIVGKNKEFTDGKETCPHCGKRVTPRVSMFNSAPYASYCPSCGNLIKMFYKPVEEHSSPWDWIKLFAIILIFVIIGICTA